MCSLVLVTSESRRVAVTGMDSTLFPLYCLADLFGGRERVAAPVPGVTEYVV